MTLPRGLVSYSYAAATDSLSNITAPDGGALSFTFDGFLPTSTTWAGQVTGSVSNVYDNNFRLTSRNVNGSAVSYTYDNDGLLTASGAMTFTRDVQNGLLTGTSLGGVTSAYVYNEYGEVASSTANFNTSPLYDVQYTRDALGRIASKVETTNGITSTYDYTYDLAGRLTEVKENGRPVVPGLVF